MGERERGEGVLLISNSKHSRGLYMNFEYLIAKVSQKQKDREGERERERRKCSAGCALSRSLGRPSVAVCSGPLSLSLSLSRFIYKNYVAIITPK